MTTKLAFRTPVGAVSIPAGQSKELGSVDVSPFSKIRVVADERTGSGTNIVIRLTITEGSELVAQLDTLTFLIDMVYGDFLHQKPHNTLFNLFF